VAQCVYTYRILNIGYCVDKYLDHPVTLYSCDASTLLFCLVAGEGDQCPFNATANSTSYDCANGIYWTGGSCVTKKKLLMQLVFGIVSVTPMLVFNVLICHVFVLINTISQHQHDRLPV